MKISNHQDYFDAIITNDPAKLRAVFSPETQLGVERLMNSEFDFEQDDCAEFIKSKHYEPVLPLHVALCACADDVIDVLLEFKAQVFLTDASGNNALHSLITFVFYKPEMEKQACAAYATLSGCLGEDKMAELLSTKNRDGFRPVEFAAQQGTLLLLEAMLLTPGLYLKERWKKGLSQYTFVDVTEYESGSRHDKSPLMLLAHLARCKLGDRSSARVIQSPLFSAWIDAKMAINKHVIIAWVIFRVLFLSLLLIIDYDSTSVRSLIRETANVTMEAVLCKEFRKMRYSEQQRHAMVWLLFALANIILLYDVIEVVYIIATKRYRILYNLNGLKRLVINSVFYRGCQFVTMLLITANISGNIATHNNLHRTGSEVLQVVVYLRILLPITISWSLFFFLQTAPWIGDSIISIQGMVKDIARFIVLLFIFMIPFMHIFYLGTALTSNEGCIEDFKSVARSFYTLFRISLNMVDITSYDLQFADAFYLMHVIFVYIVGIVLLNFLIAVMSNIQSQLEANRRMLSTLNKLSVACYAEARLRTVLGWYYALMRQRHFIRTGDNSLWVVYYTNRLDDVTRSGHSMS